MNVTKRDGSRQPLDIEKLHKVCTWACEGITGVSVSELELKSRLLFYPNIKTTEIQETLIRSASELITEETPNYQYVAGNLVNYHLRKEAYASFTPPKLIDQIKRVIKQGGYTQELLTCYSEDELNELGSYIKHDRDFDITYCGMEQWRGKYLIRNRTNNHFYETPNMAYMLIAMTFFINDNPGTRKRIQFVKDFYDEVSTFRISVPTPIMGGLRTPQKQFSSCVLIDCDDSLDSINATSSAIVKYVSQKAGIGINGGKIRAVGSPIRNGDTLHTGVIPFWKLFNSSVKSCSQGGIRGGAATIFVPIWHLEIEDLVVLKNNKGTEETRIRTMDYGIQISKVFYERLITGGNITLFSPSDVPELYESFFSKNPDEFKELYERAEKNTKLRKKVVPALELFSTIMTERKNTGRIYIMNVDNVNTQSPFLKSPIKQSNLCMEIVEPTVPMKSIFDEEAEIALCTLLAINVGVIKSPDDLEKTCSISVRALDNLLDYQDYPLKAAEKTTKERRYLGIGIVNFAYFLAKNDLTYQDINKEGLAFIHEWAEAWSYYLIKASVELAKERGPCKRIEDSLYSNGIFPIDTYKKTVDNLVDPLYKCDWDALRRLADEYGIRNSTLMALMPAETSALATNATNGIEPVRSLITVKQSKDGILKQVVPEFKRLKKKYDLLWDQKSPEGYLKIMAVLQKFIDNAISVNTSYNPKHYENNEIPMSELMNHLLVHYKFGGKTLYYNNVLDHAGEIDIELPHNVEEEDCESCKI